MYSWKNKIITGVIVVCILIIATTVYYFQKQSTAQKSKTEQAQYIRDSAENLMKTKQSSKAFQMLQNAVADTSYPPIQRALMVVYMGDVFLKKTDRSFAYAQKNIFVGTPYASFLDSSIADDQERTFNAVRRLYEYSLTFAILPNSYYRLAQWELNRALEDNKTKMKHISLAKEYMSKGDQVIESFKKNPRLRLREATAYTYWLQATIQATLSELEPDSNLTAQAEENFKNAINTLSQIQPPTMEGEVEFIWARLSYAQFLSHHFAVARSNDIHSLLDEIVGSPHRLQFGFTRYLTRLAEINPTFSDEQREKENIKALAIFSPNFTQMLKDLGWAIPTNP